MFKRAVISRKLKAMGIALALTLFTKYVTDVIPPEVESFITWAVTAGVGFVVKESEEFIEERAGRDDLVV